MATRKKAPSAGSAAGEHTPVSNLDATEAAGKPALQEPSTGADKKSGKTRADGVEDVTGFRFTESAADAELAEAVKDLRDIGEASFGKPPNLETVHGPDNRIQITATTVFPWRSICSLLITAADNSQWIGTGWFVGPHTLITAGHCVFIKNSGVPGRDGWVRQIRVIPGRNGAAMPYGSVVSSNFRSVTGWTNSGSENYDYGAIILPGDLGNTTGWFGFGNYNDATLQAATANISGYPGDKPGGTQWFDARRVASVNPQKVYYDIDTAGGQSGAPVWRIVSGARMAIAIHAYGGATTNSGTRINAAVYANLVAWKA